ncbi:MAG: RNA polymerase sigma factor [Ferruginibacter sp.]|nr:RNA polymerase sigma factor [Cytophagales bacterium]
MISVEEYNQAAKKYTRSVFRFLHKSLKEKEAAEDIVQDCYLKLWQNRDRVNPQKAKSWLFSVAHHAMVDYRRTAARKVPLDDAGQTLAVFQKNEFDAKAILERVLDELPPVQKSIVLLRDLEGYDYREIGEILGLNASQVRVYLFRARQQVKNAIQELTNVL